MNTARIWTLGAVVAVLAIVGAAVGLGVQPQLASASEADVTAEQVDAQNAASQAELLRLARVAARSSELEAQDVTLRRAIPQTLKLNSLSRLVRQTAALDNVEIVNLSPGTGIDYVPPVSASASGATADGSSASATPAPTASATASTATTEDTGISGFFGTTDPLITTSNFTVVPISITVTGTGDRITRFATDLQLMTRLVAIDHVTFNADKDSTVGTGIVTGNAYVLAR